MIPLRFTLEDAETAFAAWGANCGPGAVAAIMGLKLDEVRPHMGDFEEKGYTNPTLMFQVLRSLGVRHTIFSAGRIVWPAYGLARIQWDGPWTEPGVPVRARYRHTHWVGANARNPDNIGIFDINALANGTGWSSLADWSSVIVPHILSECVKRTNGRWQITHAIEVRL